MDSQLTELAQSRFECLFPERAFQSELAQLIAMSDFAYSTLSRFPEWADWLLDKKAMAERRLPEVFKGDLALLDELTAFRLLRQARLKYWLKVMWLDLVQHNPIEDSIQYQSDLAEHLVHQAYRWAFAQVQKSNGQPFIEEGVPMPMVILGMGKLGGRELNFSSDIDLIFTYPQSGYTQGGRKQIEHQVFFTRVAQKLIAALDKTTIDGQVFRVDMRLRPFGDSGPLVMSFSALEDYYQDQGREWERYAMLKARPLGPYNQSHDEFIQLIKPFVYRRYIDFSVIDSLRKMKQMIAQEVRRKGLINNIKLGAGGIREVEFIVQALQLVRGGREATLQTSSLLIALNELDIQGLMPKEIILEVRNSYLLLRQVEQYLQAFNDEQTQTLPEDSLGKARLTTLLRCSTYDEALSRIHSAQGHVRQEFELVIGEPPEQQSDIDTCYEYVWQSETFDPDAVPIRTEFIEHWQSTLDEFKKHISKKSMGTRGRDILDKLMPIVLCQHIEQKLPEHLSSVLNIIGKVVSRTAYLELLLENQGALKQLIRLSAHSAWISEHIAKYPLLLDELIDPASLFKPTSLVSYAQEIQQHFLRIDEYDLELQMEALRQFKQTHQLRIAAADATGVLDLMKVSDHLTCLAEVVVEKAIELAWHQMVARYGCPEGRSLQNKGFAVIAYGKAGGLELGYDSDLDLVFVHNATENCKTEGEKSVSARQFYLKLAQRLMHLFNTKTSSGILYELDTRLRPEGNSGLLAINLESFFQYQMDQAWTWEHQALLRARMTYGQEDMKSRFKAIRLEVLCQTRDQATLKQEVSAMREKMRTHLSQDKQSQFDLKQGSGGMADIEFIVQYLALAHASQYPELLTFSDNVRFLELAAEKGILGHSVSKQLIDAYCKYRECYHYLSLNRLGRTVCKAQFENETKVVKTVWESHFG